MINGKDKRSSKTHINPSQAVQPYSKYILKGKELNLSNPGQLSLLQAMRDRGVPLRTTVRGSSMYPFIKDRDVLTIAPVTKQQPKIGEIVAFVHPVNGNLVIHRIINKKINCWLLKGDNSKEIDGSVDSDRILGRVISVERRGVKVLVGNRAGFASRQIANLSAHNLLLPLIKVISLPLRGFRILYNRIL